MELTNTLHEDEAGLSRAALAQILPVLVVIISPFAPYGAEEMWELLGREGTVFRHPWPAYEEMLAREDVVEVVVQVNGKVRGRITVCVGTARAVLEKAALGDPRTRLFLEGK